MASCGDFCGDFSWNFIYNHSPWPLPHILIPFSMYLYYQNAFLVLFWVYFFETLEALYVATFGVPEPEDDPPGSDSLIGDPFGGLLGVFLGYMCLRLFTDGSNSPIRGWMPTFFRDGERLYGQTWSFYSFFGFEKGYEERKRWWFLSLQFGVIGVATLPLVDILEIDLYVQRTIFLCTFMIALISFAAINTKLWVWYNLGEDNLSWRGVPNDYLRFYLAWILTCLFFIAMSFIPAPPPYFIVWISTVLIYSVYMVYYAKKRITKEALFYN